MIEHVLTYGGNFLYYATFFGYVAFIVMFFRSKFWHTEMGWHVFAFMMVLAVLFLLGILRRIIGAEWFEAHRLGLTFISFLATAAVAWWRVILLVRAQAFEPADLVSGPEDTDPDILDDRERIRD